MQQATLRNATAILFFLLYLVAAVSDTARAQDVAIFGQVVNHKDATVDGANVVVVGTLHGTVTRSSGTFSFDRVRPGSYEVQVFHVDYEPRTLQVEVSNENVEIRIVLRPTAADLALSALDPVRLSVVDTRTRTYENRSLLDYSTGRIASVAAGNASHFDVLATSLDGIVFAADPVHRQRQPATANLAGNHGLQREVHRTERSGLAAYGPSTAETAIFNYQTARASSGTLTSGYVSNGGGPFSSATWFANSVPARSGGTLSFIRYTDAFRSGAGRRIDPGGYRIAFDTQAAVRIDTESALVASASVTGGDNIPYPDRLSQLENHIQGDYGVTYRRKTTGPTRYVDVTAGIQHANETWQSTTPDDDVTAQSENLESIAGHIAASTAVGNAAPVTTGVYAAFQTIDGLRTTAFVDDSSIETPTLPSIQQYQLSAKSAARVSARQFVIVGDVSVGVTSIRQDVTTASEIGQAENRQYFELDSGISATAESGMRVLLSELRFIVGAPMPHLVFANEAWVQYGQIAGRAISEDLDPRKTLIARFEAVRRSSLATLSASAFTSYEGNAVTLLLVRQRTDVLYVLHNTDRVLAGLVLGSRSSFLDIIFFEIEGRLLFGHNREYNSPAAAIPAHSLSTNFLVQSPGGGSYFRAATASYWKRTLVANHLEERSTPSAIIADLGIGYRKGRIGVETGVRNIFDRTYRLHAHSVTPAQEPRLAERGRRWIVQLSVHI